MRVIGEGEGEGGEGEGEGGEGEGMRRGCGMQQTTKSQSRVSECEDGSEGGCEGGCEGGTCDSLLHISGKLWNVYTWWQAAFSFFACSIQLNSGVVLRDANVVVL